MSAAITGRTLVAGVAGAPVTHSLSPLIHNAWIAALGLDAVYVPFTPPEDGFDAFVRGLAGGAIRGLNVTLPFKEAALAAADEISPRAKLAGAANLLVFKAGRILADNTDGQGLLEALAIQAPGFDPTAGPAVILGAGGAARGAVAALMTAGAPQVRIVNRTAARAELIAKAIGGELAVFGLESAGAAFAGANVLVNATSAGLANDGTLDLPLDALPKDAVVMDMTYKPLITPFLARAQAMGRPTVDGLEMLIRQAAPSFEAFFGRAPPAEAGVRQLALDTLEKTEPRR